MNSDLVSDHPASDHQTCDYPLCEKTASGMHRGRVGLTNGIEEIEEVLSFCGPEHMRSMKRAIQRQIDKSSRQPE